MALQDTQDVVDRCHMILIDIKNIRQGHKRRPEEYRRCRESEMDIQARKGYNAAWQLTVLHHLLTSHVVHDRPGSELESD